MQSDVGNFEMPEGWVPAEKGRRKFLLSPCGQVGYCYTTNNLPPHHPTTPPPHHATTIQYTAKNRIELEKLLENQSREKGLAWLGAMSKSGKWQISGGAVGPALTYIVDGLLQSGHMATLAHNNNEGYMPANLYTMGVPFPSGGKNKVDVQRMEHNNSVEEATTKAHERALNFFATNVDALRPFLDPNTIANLEARLPNLDVENGVAKDTGEKIMTLPAPLLGGQPESIEGKLRAYQLEGLSFLVQSFHHGMHCILADEMGE